MLCADLIIHATIRPLYVKASRGKNATNPECSGLFAILTPPVGGSQIFIHRSFLVRHSFSEGGSEGGSITLK